MNPPRVGDSKSAPPLVASAYCPHCGQGIHVYANRKNQDDADALAAWRLAVHITAAHRSELPV